MSEEEKHEWMLLYVSDKKTQEEVQRQYSVQEIARVLGMANVVEDGHIEITDRFWSEHEMKYLKGDMYDKKLPVVNIRDRLNAVECMMKLKRR
jgi:hypothetical protein